MFISIVVALLAVTVLGLAYARGPRAATTYYVSPRGSDSNRGTSQSAAWRTVARVNSARVRPGDTVLFHGGATFSDDDLTGNRGGASGRSITYGSYGPGNAILGEIWIASHNFLTFDHLRTKRIGGRGNDITVENSNIGNTPDAGINAVSGDRWHIFDNYIHDTGDSGILTQSGEKAEDKPGDAWVIKHNVIERTGTNPSITWGKHGIYLKVRNAEVINNTIANFADDGISQRYGNATIANNRISGGSIGIAYFPYDRQPHTSRWIGNTITGTETGLYAPAANLGSPAGGAMTLESFIIRSNKLGPLTGGSHDWANMHTEGKVTLSGNRWQ
jgi:Right handed beta helix region